MKKYIINVTVEMRLHEHQKYCAKSRELKVKTGIPESASP